MTIIPWAKHCGSNQTENINGLLGCARALCSSLVYPGVSLASHRRWISFRGKTPLVRHARCSGGSVFTLMSTWHLCTAAANCEPGPISFLSFLLSLPSSGVDCESSFIAVTKYLPCMGPRGERASYTFQRILHQRLAQANQEPPDNRSVEGKATFSSKPNCQFYKGEETDLWGHFISLDCNFGCCSAWEIHLECCFPCKFVPCLTRRESILCIRTLGGMMHW